MLRLCNSCDVIYWGSIVNDECLCDFFYLFKEKFVRKKICNI